MNDMELENESLRIGIISKGAELSSIYSKERGEEYLWSGDPAFWAKKSPVLFPIVGMLKNDTYYFEGKPYHLGRHGFARDMEFIVVSHDFNAIIFSLTSNQSTLANYPFYFRLDIIYRLIDSSLFVTYNITNTGKKDMFFSVGGHPAFKLPLTDNRSYTDYYLEFEHPETAGRWPVTTAGLIQEAPVPLLENSRVLPLKKELFYEDAVVFKSLRSSRVSLKSDTKEEGITVDFTGFPYLGVWAAKNADFVCIEPWCGIADSVTTDQQLTAKEGIVKLAPGNSFERTWSVTIP